MKKHRLNISVVVPDGKTLTMPLIGRTKCTSGGGHDVMLRKITRRRFIRTVMALGVPARTAKGFADVVQKAGLSYAQGMLKLIGFTHNNPPNVAAFLWAKTWVELTDMDP